MERPAPISFKLNGPKKKIKSVLFVGDSHIAKMEKEAPEVCKFEFVGIGGARKPRETMLVSIPKNCLR